MNKEIEKPQGRERALRYGLEIDRVPLPLKSLTIEAASRWAGRLADPAERDPRLREEAADNKAGLRCLLFNTKGTGSPQDVVVLLTRDHNILCLPPFPC